MTLAAPTQSGEEVQWLLEAADQSTNLTHREEPGPGVVNDNSHQTQQQSVVIKPQFSTQIFKF